MWTGPLGGGIRSRSFFAYAAGADGTSPARYVLLGGSCLRLPEFPAFAFLGEWSAVFSPDCDAFTMFGVE